MDYITIAVAFLSTILGVAYPILLQVVTNLGEKYQSENILTVFKQEKIQPAFQFVLYTNLFLLAVFIISTSCCIQYQAWVYTILYLLLIATFLLIILFLFLVKRILIYFNPQELLRHLIKKHKASVNHDNPCFLSIADITINNIKKDNEAFSRVLTDFFTEEFQVAVNKNKKDSISDIPTNYLNFLNRSSQAYLHQNTQNNNYLKNQIVSFGFIFDYLDESSLSQQSVAYLWNSLNYYSISKNDDFLIAYWKKAHQYYTSGIPAIHLGYDFETVQPINRAAHNQRNKIREDFLNFNYLVGALMLHTENNTALKRIFNYTQTLPESYEMLPETIGGIFSSFLEFEDPFDERFAFIEHTFPFPKMDGLKAHLLVKYAVRLYLVLLFIRLYFLHSTSYYRSPLELPSLPTDLNEKKLWLEKIDLFHFALEKILTNQPLLRSLDFTLVIDDNWLALNNKPSPITLLQTLKENIKESIEDQTLKQTVLPKELEKFKLESNLRINEAIKAISTASSSNVLVESKKWYVKGLYHILDKSPFAQASGSNHFNYNTISGNELKKKLLSGFMETFYLSLTKSFVIKTENLLEALENLSIDESYVIVSANSDVTYLTKNLNTPKFNNQFYDKTTVISFHNIPSRIIDFSLFILKKDDLPCINFLPPNENEIKKYNLIPFEPAFNFFGNLLDLNQYPEIQQEVLKNHPDKSIETSVLAILWLNMEIQWKKDAKVLMIRIQTPYNNRGLPDDPKKVVFA